jgi:TolB-like protein
MALASILSGVALSAWLLRRDGATPPADPRIVAVLPFEDLSQDESDEYLALGLTDAVATQLARLRAVAVPTVLSASTYQGARKSWSQMAREMEGKPWRRIAQELEADAILRGSVQRIGDDVQLDIQLFEVTTGRRSWTRSCHG